MKKFFITLFVGTLLTTTLFGWFAPTLISWWFAPPVEIAVNCKGAVEWGITAYRNAMLTGAIIGAVLSIFFYVLMGTKKKPKPPVQV